MSKWIDEKHLAVTDLGDDYEVRIYSENLDGYFLFVRPEFLEEYGMPTDPNGGQMFCNQLVDDMIDDEQDEEDGPTSDRSSLTVSWISEFAPGCGVRRSLPQAEKRKKLREQKYQCFYCGLGFKSYVSRDMELVQLKPTWDHRLPFALTGSSCASDFVAACQICNAIKSSKVFRTVEDARIFVLRRWVRKGWVLRRSR